MTDFSHLDAIQARIGREKAQLAAATTISERQFRMREIAAAEREETAEYAFLGIKPFTLDDISDDDLLRELGA